VASAIVITKKDKLVSKTQAVTSKAFTALTLNNLDLSNNKIILQIGEKVR